MDGCCVYLLKSETSNRTYVGFTVNMARRLRQHNGDLSGGARATTSNRPWSLACKVTGFPDRRLALSFEWYWKRWSRTRKGRPLQRRFAAMRDLMATHRKFRDLPLNAAMFTTE